MILSKTLISRGDSPADLSSSIWSEFQVWASFLKKSFHSCWQIDPEVQSRFFNYVELEPLYPETDFIGFYPLALETQLTNSHAFFHEAH